MTQEEFDKFEEEIRERGYRKYPSANNADFAYFKGFGESEYEEDRRNYQICFDVYDFSKYAGREAYFTERPFGVQPLVLVSRNVNDRVDLSLASASIKEQGIEYIERLGESFFKWVEQNIEIGNERI